MNTKIILRRVAVSFISVAILLLSLFCVLKSTFLNSLAWQLADFLNEVIPLGDSTHNINVTYENAFFLLSFLGIGLAVSFSVLLFFWDRTIQKWKVKVVTTIFMILLLIISLLNYSYHDKLWRIELQVLVDYATAYFGAVVLQYLYKVRPRNEHTTVLYWLTFAIISLFGIVIPFAYGTIYLLDKMGVRIGVESDKWVNTAATLISLYISWRTYQKSKESTT